MYEFERRLLWAIYRHPTEWTGEAGRPGYDPGTSRVGTAQSVLWLGYGLFYWFVFDSRQRQDILLLCAAFRLPLGPIQPSLQFVLASLSSGVKRLGREAGHSFPPSAHIRNGVPCLVSTGRTLLLPSRSSRPRAVLSNVFIYWGASNWWLWRRGRRVAISIIIIIIIKWY
jgi:hypothetical protein